MSGYSVGPTLAAGERPFTVGWESDPRTDDGHSHEWESVLLPASAGHRMQECIRCSSCGCPRCGQSSDEDPCMERRHHRESHRYLSGRTEKVGG